MNSMPRKGENIYKRKDGRWEGRFKKGRKENGQLKYGYLYGPTYLSVKERLYTYKLKYQTLIQFQGESALSYEDWGMIWLIQQQSLIKASTYSTYLYKLKKYIFPTIGSLALNELTKENVRSLIEQWQQQGLKATTIHVLYHILKKSLASAREQEKIIQNPCEGIRLPKKKRTIIRALTKTDQLCLEEKAKAIPGHKGIPVLLALNTGMRIGEIAALRWQDIDFTKKVIYVHQTFQRLTIGQVEAKTQLVFDQSKTMSSNRIIPIGRTLYKYLKKWHRKSKGSYVCSNKETPSEPRLLTYYFHQLRKICGLEMVHFHQLRHTFATRCIESNGDVASVSKLLGHTSTKTTLDIYTDSLLESREQVIYRMDLAKK